MGSVAYGPSPCPAVPAVPSLALPADPQPHRRARARVNPCPCPKPARQPEFQPPHQPLWAGTPDLSIPSIPSQVLMGNEHYFQTLTKQPFILLFLFFPLSKSPPPLAAACRGCVRKRMGNSANTRSSPNTSSQQHRAFLCQRRISFLPRSATGWVPQHWKQLRLSKPPRSGTPDSQPRITLCFLRVCCRVEGAGGTRAPGSQVDRLPGGSSPAPEAREQKIKLLFHLSTVLSRQQ